MAAEEAGGGKQAFNERQRQGEGGQAWVANGLDTCSNHTASAAFLR